MKNKSYRLLSLLLSILVLISACICPAVVNAGTVSEDTKVLHFEANNKGPLAQRDTLIEGETYVFSFSLSNGLGFKVDLFDNSNRDKAKGATATQVSATDKGKYTEYVYEILVPDIFTETSGYAFVGIQFDNKISEGYFFNASLYNKSDASKTEMFENGDFSSGYLNYWCWRWNRTTTGADNVSSNTYTNSDGDVFLEVVSFKDTSMHAREPKTETYYVMSTGHDNAGTAGNGKTESTPAATVADVIATIKADGLTAGDTATVYILQDADGTDKYNTTKTTIGTKSYMKHNITSWCASTAVDGKVPAYDFTLVIKSPEGEQNYLAFESYVGVGAQMHIGGPTVFENVTLLATKKDQDATVVANGYDVTLGEKTAFAFLNSSGITAWGNITNQSLPVQLSQTSNAELPNDVNITLKNAYNYNSGSTKKTGLHFSTYRYKTATNSGKTTHKGDVNVVIDNKDAAWSLVWGGSHDKYNAIFEKTLNINIKSASKIVNGTGHTGTTGAFSVTNGIQIIYPSTTDFEDPTTIFTEKGITKYWILENTTGDADIISFVEDENGDVVAGKYNVKKGYDVVAKNADGIQVDTGDNNKPLVLPAGKYTITATKKVYNYYVMSTGHDNAGTAGDGRTQANPAATVADVIATIKADGLTLGDTATVYIMQDTDGTTAYNTTKTTIGTKEYMKHNITSWCASTAVDGKVPAYDFTLVIKSPEGEQNYLAFESYVGVGAQMHIGGPTVFENVTLLATKKDQDATVVANGYDVTLGEKTAFAFLNTSGITAWGNITNQSLPVQLSQTSNAELPNDVNITFKNAYNYNSGSTKKTGLHFSTYRYKSATNSGKTTHKGDVNVVIDNKDAAWSLVWGGSHDTYNAIFEKTLNINIKSASKIVNGTGHTGTTGAFSVTNGIQIIYPSTTDFEDPTTIFTEKGITKYWILENNTGDADIISFVEDENGDVVAGKYNVKAGAEIVAVDASNNEYAPVDGVLTLEASGKYTIKDASGPKMLYFNANHRGPLMQRVTVETGKTYTYTFSLSESVSEDDVTVGAFHQDDRSMIAQGTKNSAIDKGGYVEYTYEVTMPETMTDKNGAPTNNTFVGIKFTGTAPFEGYFFNAGLYKNEDTAKTEMFTNGDFANGCLDMWLWEYTSFRGEADKGKKEFTSTDGKINLKVVLFDETLMPDMSPKMLHINSQNAGPLGQLITAKAGETYTITFAISNNAKFDVVTNDGSSRHKPINSKVEFVSGEDKGRYAIWTYDVTMPDDLTETTNNVLLGIRFNGTAPYDCYLFDVLAYESSDAEKTNLFKNGDFMSGVLDNWRFKYTNIAAGLANSTFTEDSKSVTLEVMKFDETKMADVAAEFPDLDPKMLHIQTNHTGPLNQQVTVEGGETYIYKFTASNSLKFDVVVVDNDKHHVATSGVEIEFIEGQDAGKYATWTYKITMPETIISEKTKEETNIVRVGLKLKGTAPYDGYVLGASFYKESDNSATNQLKNNDFFSGELNNWTWKAKGLGTGQSKYETTEYEDGDKKYNLSLEVVKFDESVMQSATAKFPPKVPQMVHITGEGTGPFFQQVTVEPGQKYTMNVTISNNVKFDVIVNKQSAITVPVGAEIKFVDGVDKGKYSVWTYEITMPQVIMNGDTKNGEKETTAVLVGIQLKGATSFDGYLAGVSLYNSSDNNKTELFKNGNFANGCLDYWRWRYQNYSSNKGLWNVTFKEKEGETEKETTLEVVDFDVNKMADATAKFPPKVPQMLHITGTSTGPFFQQVTVEPGQKYTMNVTISNNVKFDVIVNKQSAITTAAGAEIAFVDGVDKGKYSVWTYEITMPQVIMNGDTKKGEKETTAVLVGIQLKGATSFDGYLADVSLYKSSDKNKTELFKNGDFANGCLDYWRWRYQNYSSNKGISKANFTETEGVTEKETTLEVVDFDVNKMADATAKFQPKVPQMLHIVTDHAGPLGQIVSLEAGETYTFTFAISNNASFDVAVNDGDKRHTAVSAKIDYVGSVDKGRYAIWTYTIKMPDNLSSKNVLLGIKLKGPKNEKGQYDCYFADALLYKTSDTTKKNILNNADFSIGALDSWNWKYQRDTAGKSLYEKRFTDGKNDSGQDLYYNVLLEVMNFDESKMAQASAVMPDHSKKMIYFKNGAITQSFAAWVDCQPGDKFIVSYSIFATDEVVPHFNRNGLRGNVNGNPELLSEVKNGNYTTYTYKMTVPEDYDDDLIFLGLKMPFYAEGYIFDLEAYKDGDANKKSVWKNGDFVYGFNDWIWGWTVTWFTQAGNQLKEWSDGMNEIKIVPYDLSLIDALVAEINRDDGEWWKPADIIESVEEEQGIGTIKGTFTDQDGKPIAKVKLILKSDSRTYTTLTNKKGEFEFKDIEADYYELYYVNSKGEEVLTSFSYGLSNGDTVTLKIVTDTSKLGKAPVSGLSGTLYTPDLETVANLKIYLRGFGETVTDKDGNFSFGDVPVGTYELYTILEDGTEYVFRTVEIKENIDLGIKVKYDPESVISTTQDNSNQGLSYWIWIIIGCGGVVLVSGGLVTTLLILKKKRKAIK